MDSQDYLDQISRSARPVQPNKGGISGILSSKYFKWGAIAFGIFMVAVLLGAFLGSGGKEVTPKDKCLDIKLHSTATAEAIGEYQPYLKSSTLRSLSASLQGILTNTASQMGSYMEQTYGEKEANTPDQAAVDKANTAKDVLKNDLFEAKINGLLDRVFSHKMTLEIYSIMSDEGSLNKDTKDANLQSLLSNSFDSLNNLYTQFNDFSETK